MAAALVGLLALSTDTSRLLSQPCVPPRSHRNSATCYSANRSSVLSCTEIGGTIVQRQPTCMQADSMPASCATHVKWAMETGIKEHPKWYSKQSLTSESSPDDFLRALTSTQGVKRGCMKACGDSNADVPWPGVLECTGAYSPAVRCFPGVTAHVGGVDTCLLLTHSMRLQLAQAADKQTVSPLPPELCSSYGLRSIFRPPTCSSPHNLPPKCEEHVSWAVNKGLSEHPEWYEGLTAEAVTRNAAGKARLVNLLASRMKENDFACLPTCSVLPKAWPTIPYPGMWACIKPE